MNYELRIVVTGIGFTALDGDDARTIALDVITDRATSGPAPMPRVVEVMGVGSDVRVRVSVDAADLTAATVVVQDLADTLCARLREAELRDTRTDSLDNGGLGDDGDADDRHDHYDPNVPDWVTLSVEIRPEQRRAEREQQPDPIPDVSIPRHGVTSINSSVASRLPYPIRRTAARRLITDAMTGYARTYHRVGPDAAEATLAEFSVELDQEPYWRNAVDAAVSQLLLAATRDLTDTQREQALGSATGPVADLLRAYLDGLSADVRDDVEPDDIDPDEESVAGINYLGTELIDLWAEPMLTTGRARTIQQALAVTADAELRALAAVTLAVTPYADAFRIEITLG